MIQLDRVTKRFPDGTVAVDELSLEVPSGEVLALLGTSGSGKTTTRRMINRLIEPTSGAIVIDGRDVRALDVHELRRGIGYVIQQGGLFPHKTVIDNVTSIVDIVAVVAAKPLHRVDAAGAIEDIGSRIADDGLGDFVAGQIDRARAGVVRRR